MLAKEMEKCPVTAIYSSPQIRAMRTTETLARAWGAMVILMLELAETGYSDWGGRTVSDISTKEQKLYEEWWQHPATVAPPGGETLNQVDARCKKAWKRTKGEMKGDTTVVAYRRTLVHFIVHLPEGQPDAAEILVGDVSITTIEYDPVIEQCSPVGLNDCSHLM